MSKETYLKVGGYTPETEDTEAVTGDLGLPICTNFIGDLAGELGTHHSAGDDDHTQQAAEGQPLPNGPGLHKELSVKLQPLAAKPGSGGGSPPHISALFQVTKARGDRLVCSARSFSLMYCSARPDRPAMAGAAIEVPLMAP